MEERGGSRLPFFESPLKPEGQEVEVALRPALPDGLFHVLRCRDKVSHTTKQTETKTPSTPCPYTDHSPWFHNDTSVPNN